MSEIAVRQDHSESSLARWADVVCGSQVLVQTHLCGDIPFSGKLATHQLGAVTLRHFQSTPVRYVRGAREISQGPCDTFEVSLTLRGRAIISQDGKEVVQHPGDVVLIDTAQPFDYVLPEGDEQVVIDIPRVLLEDVLPGAKLLACSMLDGDSVFGELVGKMLRDAQTVVSGVDEARRARVGTTIIDLLATAYDLKYGAASQHLGSGRSDALARVKRFMMNNLSDSSLDVATIARENHLSVRSLHRLFATQGTTAIGWLWQQRLNASYKALSVGRSDRVSDVAMMYGFTNFSHFARAFKLAFGLQPQALLRSRATPEEKSTYLTI